MGKLYFIFALLVLASCKWNPFAEEPEAKISPEERRMLMVDAAEPLQLYPTDVRMKPGETRLFFARRREGERFAFDSHGLTWKIEEKKGKLKPHGKSHLYYSFTAPKKPGTYHLVVTLKGRKDPVARAAIQVGSRALSGSDEPQ